MRCTIPAKLNSAPAYLGGVAGGLRAAAWAAVGGVAGRCMGSFGRRCGHFSGINGGGSRCGVRGGHSVSRVGWSA